MLTHGNVTSPIGHTRALPVPGKPVPIRPVQRRNTSPFTTTAPAAPDPDAIARLERLGYVTVQAVTVDEKPMKLVTRHKKKKPTRRPAPRGRTDLDTATLAAEYEAGATIRQLALKHHTDVGTISNRLRAAGATIREHALNNNDPTTQRIIELHQDGLTHKQIGAQVGLSDVAVGNRLRARGLHATRRLVPFDEDLAVALAREGQSANAIARVVGVARHTVIDRLAGHGIDFGHGNQSADTEAIVALANRGNHIAAIARELDLSERTIRTHLRRAGVTIPDGRSVSKRRRVDITAEALAVDYRDGMTVTQIAKKHQVAQVTVRRRLATIPDFEWRDDKGCGGIRTRTAADVEAAVAEAYRSGVNSPEVARRFEMPVSTVHSILNRLGVPKRTAGESQRGHAGMDRAAGLKELMRSNGVTAADVRAWATATGRQIPPRGLPSRALLEDYLLHHRSSEELSA